MDKIPRIKRKLKQSKLNINFTKFKNKVSESDGSSQSIVTKQVKGTSIKENEANFDQQFEINTSTEKKPRDI